ncbi:hypothetical protein EVA_15817 [gut metagenome]|uniref:Uncharacterized protein n=1 Tax=gut metagenome TaxID=749906 RepID=J9FMD9_9ZZZZ
MLKSRLPIPILMKPPVVFGPTGISRRCDIASNPVRPEQKCWCLNRKRKNTGPRRFVSVRRLKQTLRKVIPST